jgi:hypothetical protein
MDHSSSSDNLNEVKDKTLLLCTELTRVDNCACGLEDDFDEFEDAVEDRKFEREFSQETVIPADNYVTAIENMAVAMSHELPSDNNPQSGLQKLLNKQKMQVFNSLTQ